MQAPVDIDVALIVAHTVRRVERPVGRELRATNLVERALKRAGGEQELFAVLSERDQHPGTVG